jgi:hypothetical protein
LQRLDIEQISAIMSNRVAQGDFFTGRLPPPSGIESLRRFEEKMADSLGGSPRRVGENSIVAGALRTRLLCDGDYTVTLSTLLETIAALGHDARDPPRMRP